MLAQLENECGFVKNFIGETVSHLVARSEKMRLDRAGKLALDEVVLLEIAPSAGSAQSSSKRGR
eukprot:6192395-Pleurochrysis_carterae.AAC.4